MANMSTLTILLLTIYTTTIYSKKSTVIDSGTLFIHLKLYIMQDFIHTGWYAPTLTTTEDPWLKVIERDNGISWTITFYVGEHIIDRINMEWCRGSKLNKDVLRLPVYSDEDIYLGSVAERLEDAINVMYPEPMFKKGE